jgi:hypothetical protein
MLVAVLEQHACEGPALGRPGPARSRTPARRAPAVPHPRPPHSPDGTGRRYARRAAVDRPSPGR